MIRLRVLIVDDHAAVRGQLANLLGNSEFDVAGEATDGVHAVEMARELVPDIVLLDVAMPVMDGFEAAALILGHNDTIRIVFVSQSDQAAYIEEARRIGARGYVLKRTAARQLRNVLESVVAGSPFTVAA